MSTSNHSDQGDMSDYEVGQEQLDAVDRMLEELDMDDRFDHVPAAFRIVERFEQQQQQQQHLAQLNHSPYPSGSIGNDVINGQHANSSRNAFSSMGGQHRRNSHNDDSSFTNGDRDIEGYTAQGSDNEDTDQEGSNDDMAREPFGYIPLDQGDYQGNSDDDEDDEEQENSDRNTDYARMQSDNDDDNEETIQGYDGYLRRRNRDGTVPVPMIPEAVQIDLSALNHGDDSNEDSSAAARVEAAGEPIPEEDLKMIAMVMNSFSLPAPEWAQSIPEERWLPRLVRRAEASAVMEAAAAGTESHAD
ncbi:hypothetical protein FBU30_001607 [Linnemannia zychae]|nr:hypothetical protein FBU30_001607 [Linnemannia zychae]